MLTLPGRCSVCRALFACMCSNSRRAMLLRARPVCSERDTCQHGTSPALGCASSAVNATLRSRQLAARRSGAVSAAGAVVAAGKQWRECGGGAAVRRYLGQRAECAACAATEPIKPQQRKWWVSTLWFKLLLHCLPAFWVPLRRWLQAFLSGPSRCPFLPPHTAPILPLSVTCHHYVQARRGAMLPRWARAGQTPPTAWTTWTWGCL